MNNKYDKIQDNIKLKIENQFDDEYFKLIDGIDNYLFEDKIYISNYGEIYNRTQNRLLDYENSSVQLKILNSCLKSFSRWNLTVYSFYISNGDYENKRRLKKISYGYTIQNQKKFKMNKIKKISEPIVSLKKENNTYDSNNLNIAINEVSNMANSNVDILQLELYKYKFIYNEILNQKIHLELKIKEIEGKIESEKNLINNRYTNTIIYIIRPKRNNFYMYIGHTIDKDRRLKEHMRSTDNDNTKLYKTIRETGGWEHWEMIEIGSYVCNCKEDALKIEQDWCEKLRPNLNSTSPFS